MRFLIFYIFFSWVWFSSHLSNAFPATLSFPLTGASGEKIYGAGIVLKAGFTPEGDLVTAGSLGVLVWDKDTYDLKRLVGGPSLHTRPITDYFITDDGKEILTGGMDGKSQRVRWESGEVLTTYAAESSVLAVRVSPDGRWVATGHEDGTVRLWETETGTLLNTYSSSLNTYFFPLYSQRMEFLDENRLLVQSVPQRGPAAYRVLNLQTGETGALCSCDTQLSGDFDLSPDRTRIIMLSAMETVEWDLRTDKQIRSLPGGRRGVYSSRTGDILLSSSNEASGPLLLITPYGSHAFYSQQNLTSQMQFSPDGMRFLTVHEFAVFVWSRSTLQVEHAIERFGFNGEAALSPDERFIACGIEEPQFWDIARGTLSVKTHNYQEKYFLAYRYSLDSNKLYGFSGGSGVYAWDTDTGNELWKYKAQVYQWNVSQDGRRMAFGEFDASRAYFVTALDTESGLMLYTTGDNSRTYNFVGIRADGQEMYVVPYTGSRIFVYDLDAKAFSRLVYMPVKAPGTFIVHPDGKSIVVEEKKRLFQVNLQDGEILQQYDLPVEEAGALVYSPDEKQLLVGLRTGTILIFDAETGAPVRVLEGHTYKVNRLQFFRDGNRLLSSSVDGTMRIWNLNPSGIGEWRWW